MKVWQSYHVAKLPCDEVTGNRNHCVWGVKRVRIGGLGIRGMRVCRGLVCLGIPKRLGVGSSGGVSIHGIVPYGIVYGIVWHSKCA